ncbi:hypothetical protein [Cohnella sp. WQ 127256]|uniref:hypothetical protein n=1 Tax=Cohnella sp. WQ 127256 TaxID=2938790 RepID=UPI0021174E04|nr:hypothetical protein [Cohnella sp. WQ 127256]
MTVKRFTGSAWESVGNAEFSVGTSSSASISIAFDSDGTPYVAYRDDARRNRVTVMKYESNTWSPVGNSGFSADDASWVRLARDSKDNMNVSYTSYTGNSYKSKLTVMKYDPYLHQP